MQTTRPKGTVGDWWDVGDAVSFGIEHVSRSKQVTLVFQHPDGTKITRVLSRAPVVDGEIIGPKILKG